MSPVRSQPSSVIAARVAEIDFAVLNDRVVPVGDVDRAVRPLLHFTDSLVEIQALYFTRRRAVDLYPDERPRGQPADGPRAATKSRGRPQWVSVPRAQVVARFARHSLKSAYAKSKSRPRTGTETE